MKSDEKITRARIKLQKSNPFFAYLTMYLKPTKDDKVEKSAIDPAGNLRYNEKFIQDLSEDEVTGVLCHQVMHCVLEHLTRKESRDERIFDISADMVVNDMLVSNGFSLPYSAIIPHEHSFKINDYELKDINKKSAEEVYDEIYPLVNNELTRFDEHDYGRGQELTKANEVVLDWKEVLAEAATYAKIRGELPVGAEGLVEDRLRAPVANWRELLWKHITRQIPVDFTYAKPSKKSISTGFYMPATVKETLDIVVALDTSGSISDEEYRGFLSEMMYISRSFTNIRITAINCDADVQKVIKDTMPDVLLRELRTRKGYGGTDFRAVFRWIHENKPSTQLLIYFTDGFGTFPDESRLKTIWVLSKDSVEAEDVPFGAVIE